MNDIEPADVLCATDANVQISVFQCVTAERTE